MARGSKSKGELREDVPMVGDLETAEGSKDAGGDKPGAKGAKASKPARSGSGDSPKRQGDKLGKTVGRPRAEKA